MLQSPCRSFCYEGNRLMAQNDSRLLPECKDIFALCREALLPYTTLKQVLSPALPQDAAALPQDLC